MQRASGLGLGIGIPFEPLRLMNAGKTLKDKERVQEFDGVLVF